MYAKIVSRHSCTRNRLCQSGVQSLTPPDLLYRNVPPKYFIAADRELGCDNVDNSETATTGDDVRAASTPFASLKVYHITLEASHWSYDQSNAPLKHSCSLVKYPIICTKRI